MTVTDGAGPFITLNGDVAVIVEAGTNYIDAGATASDVVDGDLTANLVVVNSVDTAKLGIYTVTYNVSDSNGNAAVEMVRTITVVDTTGPVITLTGDPEITVEAGATYSDAGATATDAVDGDVTANIESTGTVDTTKLGKYILSYNVSDAAENTATAVIRTVTVADTTAPVITIKGSTTVNVETGGTYVDEGATAADSFEGDLTADITLGNPVDTTISGSYTVSYSVKDSSGNEASATRTVVVSDNSVPVIILLGDADMTAEAGLVFTDPGATASDSADGDLSLKLT